MTMIVKPTGGFNFPSDISPNHRSDGFDPLIPYQMVPLGQTREMVVETGNFKAELDLMIPDISSMSNFRILRQRQSSLFPLPGPGTFVKRIALPERTTVQFTLSGRAIGMTVLEGRERPGLGVPLLKPEFRLLISVKRQEIRRVAVCYVFDRINRDTGARRDFAGKLAEVHNVFHEQANFSILNIDGRSASTPAARTITLNGTSGKKFNIRDNKLKARLLDAFDAKFPGVSERVHTVVFSVQVPLLDPLKPKEGVLGFSQLARRQTTGRKFSLLVIGPQDPPRRPTRGGPQPSKVRELLWTMAHELGHSLGLGHDPDERPKDNGKTINPLLLTTPSFLNLMFPTNLFQSTRINGAQVELLHQFGPQFREADF